MLLEDLLPYINENSDLVVFKNGKRVGHYNGKDSISEKYNKMEVCKCSICSGNSSIEVEVTE